MRGYSELILGIFLNGHPTANIIIINNLQVVIIMLQGRQFCGCYENKSRALIAGGEDFIHARHLGSFSYFDNIFCNFNYFITALNPGLMEPFNDLQVPKKVLVYLVLYPLCNPLPCWPHHWGGMTCSWRPLHRYLWHSSLWREEPAGWWSELLWVRLISLSALNTNLLYLTAAFKSFPWKLATKSQKHVLK